MIFLLSKKRKMSKIINHNYDENEYLNINTEEVSTISYEQLTNFWTSYCHDCDYDEKYIGNYAEFPKSKYPIIACFTLSFDNENIDKDIKLYNNKFIHDIIISFQEAIGELFVRSGEREGICCLLQSENNYINKDHLCVQFVLHFPFTIVSETYQHTTFLKTVISKLRNSNPLRYIERQPINDWNDIIHLLSFNEPYPLYRSNRNIRRNTSYELPPIKFVGVYGALDESSTLDNCEITLEEVFDPVNHSLVTIKLIDRDVIVDHDTENRCLFWLPLFLSLHFYTIPVNIKTQHEIPVDKYDKFDYVNNDNLNHVSVLHELLYLLPSSATDEICWNDIGKVIYNIYSDKQAGLSTWKEWTSKTDKYSVDECDKLYMRFNYKNFLDIKTLAWYLQEIFPDKYRIWKKKWIDSAIKNALKLTHTDVGRALYRCYWLDYLCDNIEAKKWYYFDGIIWKEDNGANRLNIKIINDFVRILDKMSEDIIVNNREENDDTSRSKNANVQKNINTLIMKLKTVSFKNNVISEASRFFYHEDFNNICNCNPNLLPVANGMVETIGDYARFRKAKPQDYFTMKSDVFYHDNYTMETPEVKSILKWWHQMYPDEELFNYAMKIFASGLRSGNNDKIIVVHTGISNNSKSVMKKNDEIVFGPFSWTLPQHVWTDGKRSSGGPTPEVAGCKYAKRVWSQEPNGRDKMATDFMKSMSGDDRFFVRKLHDNGGMTEVMFKLNIMCNKIPGTDEPDKAMQSRLRIIPYISQWLPKEEVPETEEEQYKKHLFPADNRFSDNLPRWASASLWLYMHYYHIYQIEGLNKIPRVVKKATDDYWEENDIYAQFVKDQITIHNITGSQTKENPKGKRDDNFKLPMMNLYQSFKLWYQKQFGTTDKIPARDSVKYQMELKLGDYCDKVRGWKGYQLKENPLDISDSWY